MANSAIPGPDRIFVDTEKQSWNISTAKKTKFKNTSHQGGPKCKNFVSCIMDPETIYCGLSTMDRGLCILCG